MKTLPKIVQTGLRTTAEPHPTDDLLAAFSERGLPPQERNNVLEHLALCADCREVVSLAMPEVPAQSLRIRPVSAWRPVLAWSGVAACVVLAVSLLMVRQNRSRRNEFARLENPAVQMKRSSGLPSVSQKESGPVLKTPPNPSKDAAAPALLAKLQAPQAANQSLINKPVARTQTQSSAAFSAPVPAASAVAADTLQASNNRPAAAPQMRESFAASVRDNSVAASKFKIDDRYPHWTLNSDGALLRSFNTGVSWEKISIPGNTALLHSIATIGPDVWVGGASGVIYHSADAGAHWLQVKAASGDKALADDVISIEFTTPLQGKLTTSHQEIWTTSDGGESWNTR